MRRYLEKIKKIIRRLCGKAPVEKRISLEPFFSKKTCLYCFLHSDLRVYSFGSLYQNIVKSLYKSWDILIPEKGFHRILDDNLSFRVTKGERIGDDKKALQIKYIYKGFTCHIYITRCAYAFENSFTILNVLLQVEDQQINWISLSDTMGIYDIHSYTSIWYSQCILKEDYLYNAFSKIYQVTTLLKSTTHKKTLFNSILYWSKK